MIKTDFSIKTLKNIIGRKTLKNTKKFFTADGQLFTDFILSRCFLNLGPATSGGRL